MRIDFLLIHIQHDIKLIQPDLLFFQFLLLGEGTLRLFPCRFQLRLYVLQGFLLSLHVSKVFSVTWV